MSLKQTHFLPFYNSKINDIVEDFYVPALSQCKIYKRVSAFFDSSILNLYSVGLENIIKNNGHIFFIFSSEISEEDFEQMKQGYELRKEIEEKILQKVTIDNPSIEITNLAYLIANNYVDIKIAFTKSGIVHDKFGLIEDGEDVLYFRGSNNETPASIKKNMESFETSLSWNNDTFELAKINNAEKQFDNLWNDSFPGTVVVEIPEVVKRKLVSYSKGKLILAYENSENSFVLDLDDDKHLVGYNNLDNPELLLPPDFWYMGHLMAYVINEPSLDDRKYRFDYETSYLDIKDIISVCSERGIKVGFEVYVTPRLRSFLYDSDIQAEKRRSLGIAIKQRSNLVLDRFNRFKEIVDSITIRKLRDPQMWDAYHIAEMIRSANFSVPGSGKTTIVYGAFAYLLSQKKVKKMVMIGPINSFMAWKNEFKLNFGDNIPLHVYDYQQQHYSSAQQRYDGITNDTDGCNLILFNYESVPANVDALKTIIDSDTMLVFDEVHRIKSVDGERAKACLDISKKANYKVVLSGTPIPNGYVDIHNFLKILFPDEYNLLFNYDVGFLKSANSDLDKQNKINEDIYPFFCRTTKKDLKVPPPEEDDITTGLIQFDEDYSRILGYIYRECSRSILLLYIRLMQASTNPALILKKLSEDDLHALDSELDSSDFSDLFDKEKEAEEYSDEEIQEIIDYGMTEKYYRGLDLAEYLVSQHNQVIIWETFVDSINRTYKDLTDRGIKCRVIYGSVPLSEREKNIIDFINKKYDVLITNPHTLAESVSLHKNCHHAIYMEYSFNLVHMLQSRDRIHRLGLEQTDKTYYYYMMMDNPLAFYNTIDRKIYDRLKFKEELQAVAVEGDDLIYQENDLKDDIESLFKD